MHKFNINNIEKLDNPERRKIMPPEEILSKLKIADDGPLLDAGCGTGYFTISAAKILKNNKVTGIDIIPEIVGIAKDKAKGTDNIEFIVCKEYSFPIGNESMRYVLLSNVMHEIEDKSRYFSEVRRVLKEGGYLLIIDWDKRKMEMGPPVHERISEEEMTELCKKAGFKISESINVSMHHYGLIAQK